MKVIIHPGAHGTNEDRLTKTLLRNRDRFLAKGCMVPGPAKYRVLLKECVAAARVHPPSPAACEVLWDAILEGEQASRVVLTNQHFFGSQRDALENQRFYPEAGPRLRALETLLPDDEIELMMAIRSPIGFLPAMLEKAHPNRRAAVLSSADLTKMRWSELFIRIRQAVPNMAVTVWCQEDLPLLWPQLLRRFGGLEDGAWIAGGMDILGEILSPEGLTRLRAYLKMHPDLPEPLRRRVYAAFLDKYARDDEIEEDVQIPGWTPDFVDHVEALYDRDVQHIAAIPGVTMLTP
ncbi:hypothetical protein TRM7557_02222 [Tritonibacter multivorans]|uniref:Sulfotransferase family protein n=1 Tax=Tritonibacter multivorans TaxID=928856 RepID=A0A0P1GXZ3_9RHOB|nr:hypothetical protein [Tritonibacter multivorans]MDA7419272.1 hypothetical protein [Tritonibacter multivorans]CUH79164.1 hypothetical protein TRM7557_02222 [Tritonibacter multivorans]SFD23897.1 hypothetical protein SAMN04488049_109133 [Tritonibacter multivorans]